MEPLGVGDPAEVGAYRMLAGLGDGNMGRVLLGYGLDGRLVAVKRMHARVLAVDGFRERFRREVAACKRVSGHYTASFIDDDADDEIPWFAATYEPGPSLRDAVGNTGPLPENAVLRLAAGLASALVDIHRAGLVHRDLKPANVLLTRQGPKVIDFGVARAVEMPEGTTLTHTGMFIGTPAYMSPEQAAGDPVGPVSDVFSLGTVLAMAALGSGPFEGKPFPRTVHDVMYAEPDLSGVPARVRELIESCWVKDPADRPGPEAVLASIGRIPPSTLPWPEPVTRLITDQESVLRGLLGDGREDGTSPTLMDDGQTLLIPARGFARADNVATMPVTPPSDEPQEVPPSREEPTVVNPPAREIPAEDPPPRERTPGTPTGTPITPTAKETPPADNAQVRPPAENQQVRPPSGESRIRPPVAHGPVRPPVVNGPVGPPVAHGPVIPPMPPPGTIGRSPAAKRGESIGYGLVAATVLIGLIIWAVMSSLPDDTDDSASGYTPPVVATPEHTSPTPTDPDTTEPETTDPTTTDFDPSTLDDEDSDRTELSGSRLPESFTDEDGVEYTQYSRQVHDCEAASFADSELAQTLYDMGCRDIVMGLYLDESEDVLVTMMLIPLKDSDTADELHQQGRDGFLNWNWWCPSEPAAGWRACKENLDDAAWKYWIGSHHRYVKVARAIYTDLRSSGKNYLDAPASAAIGSVDLIP